MERVRPEQAENNRVDVTAGRPSEDADLSDMLQEIRVLLQGAQVLSAFLIVIPFNSGFANVDLSERWIYAATFLCSITSLVLLSAPAAQHRLERPLHDRERFKARSTRAILVGVGALSLALVMATLLVVSEVLGRPLALVLAATIAGLIGVMWWIVPLRRARRGRA